VGVLTRPLRRLRSEYRTLTAPLRELPSLLIIGTQKGGTTSLFNYLVQHPNVLPPVSKEIHYFDLQYARGDKWYRGCFPLARHLQHGSVTLEASPYYLFHPLVARRAAELLPKVTVVALLRNPIDRAVSHYHHEVRGGRESMSLEEALDCEAERLAGEEERLLKEPGYYSYNHHRYSYTRRGLYLEQLRRWEQHFPRSQMLIIQSERFFADPGGTTAAVYRAMGVPPHTQDAYKTFLPGGYDEALPPRLRQRLADYFEPHNRELYRWLGEEYPWS
jgi:hypothetical protein